MFTRHLNGIISRTSPSRCRVLRNRRKRTTRACLETLESRQLLSAGEFDTSFGGDGLVTAGVVAGNELSSSAETVGVMLVQPDGAIVVAGATNGTIEVVDGTNIGIVTGSYHFGLSRFTSSGELDASFGIDGFVVTDIPGESPEIRALAMQGDKILAVGTVTWSLGGKSVIALARYNADGTLDASFSEDGIVLTAIYRNAAGELQSIPVDSGTSTAVPSGLLSAEATAVVIQPTGQIVVGGWLDDAAANNIDFLMLRYTDAGAVDTSFGGPDSGGVVKTNISARANSGEVQDLTTLFSHDRVTSLAVDSIGGLVLAGNTTDWVSSKQQIAVARFTEGGVDAGVNTFTFAAPGSPSFDFAGGIAIDADGSLLLAGYEAAAVAGYDAPNATMNLARIPASSTAQTIASVDMPDLFDPIYAGVTIQPDGQYLLVGSEGLSDSRFVIARVRPGGGLDPDFGNLGVVRTSFEGIAGGGVAATVAIANDGNILVSGTLGSDFVVAKYLANTSITTKMIPDPTDPNQSMLLIEGTAGADSVALSRAADGTITLLAGDSLLTFSGISRIELFAGDGDDVITAAGDIGVLCEFYGGAGNDQLNPGNAGAIIDGGDGNDVISGGSGRDLLIGSGGADRINGNAGDDILIAGYTTLSAADLRAVLANWNSQASYQDRVTKASSVLNTQSVHDDSAPDELSSDVLVGAAGQDWYFCNTSGIGSLDRVLGSTRNETGTDVF